MKAKCFNSSRLMSIEDEEEEEKEEAATVSEVIATGATRNIRKIQEQETALEEEELEEHPNQYHHHHHHYHHHHHNHHEHQHYNHQKYWYNNNNSNDNIDVVFVVDDEDINDSNKNSFNHHQYHHNNKNNHHDDEDNGRKYHHHRQQQKEDEIHIISSNNQSVSNLSSSSFASTPSSSLSSSTSISTSRYLLQLFFVIILKNIFLKRISRRKRRYDNQEEKIEFNFFLLFNLIYLILLLFLLSVICFNTNNNFNIIMVEAQLQHQPQLYRQQLSCVQEDYSFNYNNNNLGKSVIPLNLLSFHNNYDNNRNFDDDNGGDNQIDKGNNFYQRYNGGAGNGGEAEENRNDLYEKPPIIVGYLTNFWGRHNPSRQGLSISGAISYAIDVINKERKELLNGRKLKLIVNDTSATSINGTAALIWQWRNGAVAFFGPEDTCEVEATIAGALNLPMISYKCANSAVSNKINFPTFARTHPPDVIVVRSVLALLQYYEWKKFAIVWHKRSQKFATVVSTLRSLAESSEGNFEITVEYPFDDSYECCLYKKECCGQIWNEMVEKTYKKTRIYVFLGDASMLQHFLLSLKSRRLLDNGEYIVISVESDGDYSGSQSLGIMNPFTHIPEHEMNAIYEASRSLLILTRSLPESPNYPHFVEKVREYNKLPPFCLQDHKRFSHKRHITYYASYLYDAVILYAEALSQVLKEGLTEYDGKNIIQKIIAMGRYKSITGAWMHIDQNGDVQGNYTVLQPIMVSGSNRSATSKRSLYNKKSAPPIKMQSIGVFEYDIDSNGTISFVQTNQVNWVRPGHVPLDEPPCGFDDSACDKSRDAKIREIITAILLAIFLAAIIIIILTYRGWKTEQEIDGLLWKISEEDVSIELRNKDLSSSCDSLYSDQHNHDDDDNEGGDNNDGVGDDLKEDSNNSDALSTKDDKYKFFYKGVLVSCKKLKFQKKNSNNPYDYLTRENKMEMKWLKEMHHQNINVFIGATIHELFPYCVLLLSEYNAKGSLRDVLENEEIRLDEKFLSSLVHDIVCGLSYLHKSNLRCHGNLKSTNCVVTSRFVVKLNDFGLFSFRNVPKEEHDPLLILYNNLWKPPEQLRDPRLISPEGDMYSFGIILHEIVIRKGPWAIKCIEEKILFEQLQEIVDEVTAGPKSDGRCRRPDLTITELHDDTMELINMCWDEDPKCRPSIELFRSKLRTSSKFRPPPEKLMENMVEMMEIYQNQLEDLVYKRTQQLDEEKRKTETLLYQMLPESVAHQLISGQTVIPETFEAVTIFFSDIVGFTKLSATSTPMEIVTFLNDLYCLFDSIVSHYNVYKVETIGDAYMVVSGLPIRYEHHCSEIASMALEMLESIKTFQIRHRQDQMLQLRIGLHTGPVVAGVVGTKMPRYCLFGDTVNTASRMESNGLPLKIHISPECKILLEQTKKYILQERGYVFLKGKGDVKTYWLTGHVDGPQFRFDPSNFHYTDSPWIQKDKKSPISIFHEMNHRKSSLAGSNEQNLSKLYKKALGGGGIGGMTKLNTSFTRLKGPMSNSCSAFRPHKPENHLSPKSIKKNWPFRLFNNKLRSNSHHNHPENDSISSSTNIPMKETITNPSTTTNTPKKSIVKSTSYNMIEALNTRLNNNNNNDNINDNENNRNPLQTSPNPNANDSSRFHIPSFKMTIKTDSQEPEGIFFHAKQTNHSSNEHQQDNNNIDYDESREPLLKKYPQIKRIIPNKNPTRKSSLQEVDEDFDRNDETNSIRRLSNKNEPIDEHPEKTKVNGFVIPMDDDDDDHDNDHYIGQTGNAQNYPITGPIGRWPINSSNTNDNLQLEITFGQPLQQEQSQSTNNIPYAETTNNVTASNDNLRNNNNNNNNRIENYCR